MKPQQSLIRRRKTYRDEEGVECFMMKFYYRQMVILSQKIYYKILKVYYKYARYYRKRTKIYSKE